MLLLQEGGKDELFRRLQDVFGICEGENKKREGELEKREGIFFRPLRLGVRHVLSHRVIHANFYELHLPDESATLEGYQKVTEEDLHKFAVSNLVYQFFSLILKPNH